MKVVIDIPKGTKDAIECGKINQVLIYKAWDAIKDGIPLPKGHGRLIDAWALDKEVINYVHSGDAESSKDCAKFSMMIITAPTVIEADK